MTSLPLPLDPAASGRLPSTRGAAVAAAPAPAPDAVSARRAAIVVKCLIDAGAAPPVGSLSEPAQLRLARALGSLGVVERAEVDEALMTFATTLDRIGIAGGGMPAALADLQGLLSDGVAQRLSDPSSDDWRDPAMDPWTRLARLPAEALVALLDRERRDVAAIALSNLPVDLSTEVLRRMEGTRARQVALALAGTARVQPPVVAAIGRALAQSLDGAPVQAFDRPPAERLGAILTGVPGRERRSLVDGIADADAEFAVAVRRAMLGFEDLPTRLSPADVPRALRAVDETTLVHSLSAALAGGGAAQASAEFLLGALSQRMAASLRDAVEEEGEVAPDTGDAAQTALVGAILSAAARGEIALSAPA